MLRSCEYISSFHRGIDFARVSQPVESMRNMASAFTRAKELLSIT